LEKIKGNRGTLALAAFSLIMIMGMAFIYFWEPNDGVNVTGLKRGSVGVISVEGVIEKADQTKVMLNAIQEAANDDAIDAVVLEIDSPGGSAYLIEQVYLDLLELKKTKPLVASASTALSGGYYIAVAADQIFTVPTAMVGNVGVIGVGPGFMVPSEQTFETGPQKVTGFSPSLFPFNISKALDSFASAVQLGRGSRLTLSLMELKRGSIWLGTEAVNLGVADQIGGRQAALDYAAGQAGLDSYKVVDLIERVNQSGGGLSSEYPTVNQLNEANPPPALYYLYMPNQIYLQSGEEPTITIEDTNVTETEALGQVVVDVSHGNRVSPYVMDALAAELAKRGVFLGYGYTWEAVEKALDHATCLMVVAPTKAYSYDEYEAIQSFVQRGNMLVLFSDASTEFISTSQMQGPINSLANHWGLHFGKGYLYNMLDYYGFYRNVKITQFEENWLTEGLTQLVFFTSTYLSATDSDAAYTSFGTYDSVTEQMELYAPVTLLDKANTTVVAFGDITWLMEPWLSTADNYELAMNLVEEIVKINNVS
jgi:ClpP class serine protease